MTLPPCPHCGRKAGVYRNIRAYGWAQDYFRLDGTIEATDVDGVKFSSSKTLRCDVCLRVRRDLVLAGNKVKKKDEED